MTISAVNPGWRRVFSDPVLLLAFGLGSGLSPVAPGTAGTILALLLLPLVAVLPLTGYLLVLAGTVLVGIVVCGLASKKLGVHDHSGIVLDEVAGLWLALAGFPAAWEWWLGGFLLFRFFDIVKPWPISWLDRRVSGGLGIMLDDLVAGGFAWLVLAAVKTAMEMMS